MGDWRDDLKQGLKTPEEKAKETAEEQAKQDRYIQSEVATAFQQMAKALNEVPGLLAKRSRFGVPSVRQSGNQVTVSAGDKSLGIELSADGMTIKIFEDGNPLDEIIYNRVSNHLAARSKQFDAIDPDTFIGGRIKQFAKEIT